MVKETNGTGGGDTAREFDLGELLNGSVESVIEKFADLSDDVLTKLHELEGKGGKRVTLLDAVHREQARRAEAAAGGSPASGGTVGVSDSANLGPNGEDEAPAGGDVGAAGDAASAQDDAPATFTQEQVDGLLAERDAKHAAELKAAKAGAKGAAKAKAEADPASKLIKLDGTADAPNLIALTGASKIVFVDADDMTLPKLPEMTFEPSDFDAVGDGVKLKKMIEFPSGLVGSEVSGAFLFGENGKAAGKATLVLPFGVGGGRNTRMAPGTLVFERSGAAKAA